MTDVFIYDAIRTPRGKGKQGGSLYEVKPVDLVKNLLDAMQERHQLNQDNVEDLLLGCGEPVNEQGQNIAKTALVYSGWSNNTTGAQTYRYCAAALDAVNMQAAKVMAGMEDLVMAGGVESMSRLGMGAGGAAVADPWTAMQSYAINQGVAADLLGTLGGFTREDCDKYAITSQQRAGNAWAKGYFDKSVVPVKDFNGVTILAKDEYPRPSTTMEDLAKLKPSFQMFGDFGHDDLLKFKYPQVDFVEHMHTPGNSSGIVDGASLVLLGNKKVGRKNKLTPRARIRSFALSGTEPTIMLAGPVPATLKALEKAKLTVDDIDLFELNEAFAAVVLHYQRELNIPDEKINVNGGAIAMGHPIGATGAMILGTLLDELERRNLKRGVVTLCAAGGIGIATVIERV
jgi:acetyl-CoA C-acetyltransferase